ncbi:MAG: efflux RND transporter periplasmic adaptor subunit [Myxococcota bacterium]
MTKERLITLIVGAALGASFIGLRSCASSEGSAASEGADSPGEEASWTCSMHPQVQQSEPGACPICGMDLVPVRAGEAELPPNRVVLSERARSLAKLRTEPVRRQARSTEALTLLGQFEANERTLRTVTAWTAGRVDRLRVNATGQRVRAGQVVATLYSPEVFTAHQDLLVAKRQVDRLRASPAASRQAAEAALEAARERLRLLGVPDDALARLEGQARPTRAVSIRSPFGGTVIERLVTAGGYVATGTPLFRVANLSTLWLQLDAYESDLSRLAVGQQVLVRVDALAGESFEGSIDFIEPTLDARRRTVKVRVQVDNREGRLRPGMFAEATTVAPAQADQPNPLVIAHTAPLFTGRRAVVYVEVPREERSTYEARTVRLGPRLGDSYPVVAGLSEGERVVTRGAFALDADLQIRGGTSMMTAPDDGSEGDWDQVAAVSPAERARLSPVVRAYLDVQTALADDDLSPAKAAASALVQATDGVGFSGAAENVWQDLAAALRGPALRVARADTLEVAREGFEPLSEALIRLLARFGNPLEDSLRLAYCPMAAGSEGARWVQRGEVVDNAYFGASMLTCGEVRQELSQGAFAREAALASGSP